jgi:very-short-patch-repair endonuclease
MKYKSAESNPESQTILRRELRNHSTSAEATLWKLLKNSQAGGYKFRRQHGIGPFVLDFYCPLLRLCIELDGGVHQMPLADVKDEMRTKFLNEQGITVLRFENDVVWRNPQSIVEKIIEFGRRR